MDPKDAPQEAVPEWQRESAAVYQAAEDAVQLLQSFCDSYETFQKQPEELKSGSTTMEKKKRKDLGFDNNVQSSNPWNDPDDMLKQLDAARNKLSTAWQRLDQVLPQQQADETDNDETEHKSQSQILREDAKMRAAYMDMVTDAFADELESLQQDPHLDVEILVDCLQSGLEIWLSDLSTKNEDWFQSQESGNEEGGSGLTPHEQRRQRLGYDISV